MTNATTNHPRSRTPFSLSGRHGLLAVAAMLATGGCSADHVESWADGPTGKADGYTLPFGFFQGSPGQGGPALLILQDDPARVPEGHEGRFDLAATVPGSELTVHHTGVFRTYQHAGMRRVMFAADDQRELGPYTWSVESGALVLDGHRLSRLPLDRAGDRGIACQAVQLHDAGRTEGLDLFASPTVRIERRDGAATPADAVTVGSMQFVDDGETRIDISDHGPHLTRITTPAGAQYLIEIDPATARGQLSGAADGAGQAALADLVCVFPAVVPASIPCVSEDTLRSCMESFDEYGEFLEEGTRAEHCVAWAMEDVSGCGLGCYLDCADYGGICTAEGEFENRVWAEIETSCAALAASLDV